MSIKQIALITGLAVSGIVASGAFSLASAADLNGSIMFMPYQDTELKNFDPPRPNTVTPNFSGSFTYESDPTSYEGWSPHEGWLKVTSLSVTTPSSKHTYTLNDTLFKVFFNPKENKLAAENGTSLDSAIFGPGALPDLEFFAPSSGNTYRTSALSLDPTSGSNQQFGTYTAKAVPEPLTILGSITALGFGIGFKRKQAKAALTKKIS
jgi:hypothetical protein